MSRRQSVVVLGIVLALLARPHAGRAQGAKAAGAQADFDALLARVKQSDPSVNFDQLRRLYAESKSYAPYQDGAEGPMVAAAEGGHYDTALTIANEILARNYLNLEAHFASFVACSKLGDTMCEAHHAYVARGLLGSIQKSGDGKTPATAFVVVATPEEYALLRVLGVRVINQELMSSDGHSYDALTVQDVKTGEESRIYFNVDLSLAAMKRVFGL